MNAQVRVFPAWYTLRTLLNVHQSLSDVVSLSDTKSEPVNENSLTEVPFGEWLKRQRMGQGLTREKLAGQIGCAVITIRKLESGERRPSAQICERLAEIFKIPAREKQAFLQYARGTADHLPLSTHETAPWQSAVRTPRNNLRPALTSFIGREKEVADVFAYVTNPSTRLITLVGPPGIGKTRLSLAVAHEALALFNDGVFLVELAPIEAAHQVSHAIVHALGLVEAPGIPSTERLQDGIGNKHMLIVLDNIEHLLDAIAGLASDLLSACPRLTILTTTREALRSPGEWLYPVPTLTIPTHAELASGTVETFSHFSALKLFAERGRAVRPDFKLDADNVAAVTAICAQLDGLPLAIELIAARIRWLSAPALFSQLTDQFVLSADGMRAVPVRQKKLFNTIGWSYNSLTELEQRVFRRLAVFAGGWTLPAAQMICSDDTLSPAEITEVLYNLTNKSLIMLTESASGAVLRYRILEVIRQFASEQLIEAGESSTLHDRHLAYYLELAETAAPQLHTTQQIEWSVLLEQEVENLRAALHRSLGSPSAESALRLSGALGPFWNSRAEDLEGARWLDQALAKEWHSDHPAEKKARARALYHRADLAIALDELNPLKACAEEALALCEDLNDRWGIAYARMLVATHQLFLRVANGSIPAFEQSLSEFRALQDVWGEAQVLGRLSQAYLNSGIREGYAEALQKAVVCARASGDRYLIAKSLQALVGDLIHNSQWDEAETILGEIEQLFKAVQSPKIYLVYYFRVQVFYARGNLAQAKVDADYFIECCIRIGEKNLRAVILFFLGWIAVTENDLPNAVAYGEHGLALFRELKHPAHIAFGLIVLAWFKHQNGQPLDARQHALECLEIARRGEVGDWVLLYVYCYLGGLMAEAKPDVAVRILALSETWAGKFPAPRDALFDKPYYERFLNTARAALTTAEFTTAWEAGQALTLPEAIELASKALKN